MRRINLLHPVSLIHLEYNPNDPWRAAASEPALPLEKARQPPCEGRWRVLCAHGWSWKAQISELRSRRACRRAAATNSHAREKNPLRAQGHSTPHALKINPPGACLSIRDTIGRDHRRLIVEWLTL
jgi:hypothetical protein